MVLSVLQVLFLNMMTQLGGSKGSLRFQPTSAI